MCDSEKWEFLWFWSEFPSDVWSPWQILFRCHFVICLFVSSITFHRKIFFGFYVKYKISFRSFEIQLMRISLFSIPWHRIHAIHYDFDFFPSPFSFWNGFSFTIFHRYSKSLSFQPFSIMISSLINDPRFVYLPLHNKITLANSRWRIHSNT